MTDIENVTGSNAGVDDLTGNGGTNVLHGEGGDDLLRGGAGDDVLQGGGDNDRLEGGAGSDSLHGDAGDDVLVDSSIGTTELLDGGDGTDTADYHLHGQNVHLDLQNGIGTVGGSGSLTLVSIENLVGTAYSVDILIGDGGGNALYGLAGSDTLRGGGGGDVLRGGQGADQLDGGDGTDAASYYDSAVGVVVNLAAGTGSGGDAQGDTLVDIENVTGSQQSDTLTGNAAANVLAGWGGNDLLRGGAGADTLDGGVGTDAATYYDDTTGVTVDLAAGTGSGGDAEGDTLIGVETLTGSNLGNDTLLGTTGANTLAGWGGDDVLRGGSGADRLDGGNGADIATYWESATGVTANLATGTGAGGYAQGDTYFGIEHITGSQGADLLTGSAGANTLRGEGGNDVLRGGGGADSLDGGSGLDTASYAPAAAGVTVNLGTGSDRPARRSATSTPASRTSPARPATTPSPAMAAPMC